MGWVRCRPLGTPRAAASARLRVVAASARPLAAVAAVLLVGFTGLIGLRLSQGRRPPCACFGGRTARPIGPLTILRNLGFLALAAVAIAA